MSALPPINLPSPVLLPAVPAIPAQTVQAAFVPELRIQADPLLGKPWPMSATLRGVGADGIYVTDPATGKFVDHVCNRDLRADSATLPMVAQVMGGVLTVIPLLASLDVVEKQIMAGLKATDDANKAIAAAKSNAQHVQTVIGAAQRLVDHWAEQPDNLAGREAALADATAKLATARTPLLTAQEALTTAQSAVTPLQQVVWYTLLGQWRAAALPLGVTDSHTLPPQLVGLTPPDGVTV